MAKKKDDKKKKVKSKTKPAKKPKLKRSRKPNLHKKKPKKKKIRSHHYNRPYVPQTKKSNYSLFRAALSKHLKEQGVKLGKLPNNRLALQNFNEISKIIWQESKLLSLDTIIEGIPTYVADWVKEKNGQKGYGEKPIIPLSVTFPQYYFDIDDVIWGDMPKHDYLYAVSSSILPRGMAIKLDGSDISAQVYSKSFKHWVDWCNEQKIIRGIDDSGKVVMFYAFATEAIENTEKRRWEVEIYACDRDGNVNDFGYIPPKGESIKEPEGKEEEEIIPPEQEKPIPPEKEKPTPPARIEPTPAEIIEIEKQKQKTAEKIVEKYKERRLLIQEYKEMLKDKLITKKQFSDFIDNLNKEG